MSCYLLFLYVRRIKSLASVSAPFKGGYSPSLLSSGSWNAGPTLDWLYFLNWYLTLRSFHYSLYVRCALSWGRALGPLGGLSTGQLNCCLPRMKEKRREVSKNCQVLSHHAYDCYLLQCRCTVTTTTNLFAAEAHKHNRHGY